MAGYKVFGFLKRFFREPDSVDSLRRRWARDPACEVAEKLGRKLLEEEQADEALGVLREAYRLFPKAERIRKSYRNALRVKSTQETRVLRRELEKKPRPELCARLSGLYRYLGRFEEALDFAHEGIRRYPEEDRNYLAAGRIHYNRFIKSASAVDGQQAAAYLKKAYDLDCSSFKTVFYLASLYLTVRSKKTAAFYLQRLSGLAPGDQRIQELWKSWNKIEEEECAETEPFRRYEIARVDGSHGTQAGGDLVSSMKAGEKLRERFRRFMDIEDIQEAYLVDPKGKCIAGGVKRQDNTQTASAISRALGGTRNNARRMAIGTFKEAVLKSKNQTLLLYNLEGAGLAVMGRRNMRHGPVRRRIEEFVEESLYETQGT